VPSLPDGADDLAAGGAPSFDTAHFRSVLGHFCTGVTIVAGVDDGVPLGLTCQEDLSRVFATPGADKFRGVAWRPGATGSPILGDVLAWVDCRIMARHDAGDHLIIIGRVLELEAAGRGRPLLAYRGGYGRFDS